MNKLSSTFCLVFGLWIALPLWAQAPLENIASRSSPQALRAKAETIEQIVTAGERYQTRSDESVELVFSDGSSVTLAPDTALGVEAFQYQPDATSGTLRLSLLRGLIRVSGGALNERAPIEVDTPHGITLALTRGSGVVAIENKTNVRAYLLLGARLSLSSAGETEIIGRPGFEVTARAGEAPSPAKRQAPRAASRDLVRLNPRVLAQAEEPGAEAAVTRGFVVTAAGAGDDTENQDSFAGRGLGTAAVEESTLIPSVPVARLDEPGAQPEVALDGDAGSPPPLPLPTVDLGGFDQPDALSPSEEFGPQEVEGLTMTLIEAALDVLSGPGNRSATQITEAIPRLDRGPIVLDDGNGQSIHEVGDALRHPGPTTQIDFRTDVVETPNFQPEAFTNPVTSDASDVISVFPDFEYVFVHAEDSRSALVFQLPRGTLDVPWADDPVSNVGQISISAENLEIFTDDTVPNTVNINAPDGTVESRLSFFGAVFPFDETVERQMKLLAAGFSGADGRIVRAPNNFLLFQETMLGSRPKLEGAKATQRLFATGDVDGTLDNSFAVDQFFVSPGLQGYEERSSRTVASFTRAFLRKSTAVELELDDTGLLVLGTPGDDTGMPNPTPSALLHADFGVGGEGESQRSTISTTIGEVRYQRMVSDDPNDPSFDPKLERAKGDVVESNDVFVSARSVGSTFDNNRPGEKTQASVHLFSEYRNTSAGGGNPDLANGRVGYLVFENFDPETPETGGSVEAPLGDSGPRERYAMLRLGTGKTTLTIGARPAGTVNGWMAGLAEFEQDAAVGVARLESGAQASDFSLTFNPTTHQVASTIGLFSRDTERVITLGGEGASAYVDEKRFALRAVHAAQADVAMISADLVDEGLKSLDKGQNVRAYEHVKWGFFFGDTIPNGPREHVHLATWAAGEIPSGSSLALRGSASYAGHAIGNVLNNGHLYSAVGAFENRWDFDKRAGTVNMSLDNVDYAGQTQIDGATYHFDGVIQAPDKAGNLRGSFVGDAASPDGVAGKFAIKNTAGDTYRAAGTFAAEK